MIEGIPEQADLFREGLHDGDAGVVTGVEAFVFLGSYQGSEMGGRLALALELHGNQNQDIRRVVSVVLNTRSTATLIGLLQDKLQRMEAADDQSSRTGRWAGPES